MIKNNVFYLTIISSIFCFIVGALIFGLPITVDNPTWVYPAVIVYLSLTALLSWYLFADTEDPDNDIGWKIFIKPFVFSIWFIVALQFLFPAVYVTNDDVVLQNWASSGFDLCFISVLAGRILGFLYQSISSDIPWYGLFLYVFNILSLSLIINGIMRLKMNRNYKFVFFLLILSFFVFIILNPTFTHSSILLAASSVFTTICLIKGKGTIEIKYMLILGVFLALSYLVRSKGLYGVLLFSLPLLLLIAKQIRLKMLFYFLPLLILATINIALESYSVSPEYKSFIEFNSIRGKIHHNQIAFANRDNHELFKANDWTKNDYNLFVKWFFPNETKFNTVKLNRVFELSKPLYEGHSGISNYLLGNTYIMVQHYLKYFLFLSLLVLLFFFKSDSNRFTKFLMSGFLVYITCIICIMYSFFRFPDHVALPLFIYIFLCISLFTDINGSNSKRHKKWLIIPIILVIVALFASRPNNIYLLKKMVKKNISAIVTYDNMKNEIMSLAAPGSVFYVLPGIMYDNGIEPLSVVKKDEFRNLGSGWGTFSPYYYDKIKGIGISRAQDVIPWFVRNKKAYFVFPLDPALINSVSKYIAETHNIIPKPTFYKDIKKYKLMLLKLSPKE